MDYEQKYKEALERAKEIYNRPDATDGGKLILEFMFSELKESEDERIIKEIISIVKSYRESCITEGTHRFDDCISWLEKQLEQKSNNNIEPKFKVGNWVIVQDKTPYQIEKVTELPDNHYQYWTTDGHWFGDGTKSHLWTIQDAKDGDVLINDFHLIFIFKEIKNNMYISHCSIIDRGNNVIINSMAEREVGNVNLVKCQPATKEQRDLLFQKMRENGYEWDAEKKELKKIEQKFIGKNETAEKLIALAECLEMDGDCLFNGLSGNDYGKFLRVLARELTEIKPAEWSKKSENMCEAVIDVLVNNTMSGNEGDKVYSKEINWLLSLKERYTWKPSGEQMQALFEAKLASTKNREYFLGTLYEDLRKL